MIMGGLMKRTLKRWKRRECRQNGGKMNGWDEMAEYLRGWIAILTLAVIAAIHSIIVVIVGAVIWIIRNAHWIIATIVGIGIIVAWIWRSCTEKFG